MGNCLGCSVAGKQLMEAATVGDVEEVRKLLEVEPALAAHTTFAGLSSPLHVAAAAGNSEIVCLLLKRGADVDQRTIFGLTPLMEACLNGCLEVVQILLLFKCDVSKVEYLCGWTALHYAVQGGHVPCIRLLAADFGPAAHGATDSSGDETVASDFSPGNEEDELSRYINKATSGGITALHLGALSGNVDCVHLLLDLHADVSAIALYHASTAPIGSGNTALHYAACSGSLESCQVLISRGASRTAVNFLGWLPVDAAVISGYDELVPLLSPYSQLTLPAFPTSNCSSLPLISILKLAREHGLDSSTIPADESDSCVVCLERACTVAAEGCGHELCTRCALSLCSISNAKSEASASKAKGSIPCPLCREGILAFKRVPSLPSAALSSKLELCRKHSRVVPSEVIDPILRPPQVSAIVSFLQ